MLSAPRPVAAGCRAAVLLAAAALMTASGCGGSSGGTDEIKAIVAREVEATNARDMKALGKVWSQSDDILLFDVAPPGRFQGWPAIARSFNDLFEKATELHMAVDNIQVQSGGTIATATYDWALTGKMGEAALEDRGHATEIFRHEKEGWKLVHAHYSVAPRPAAEPAAAEKPPKPEARKPAAGPGPAKKPAARK
jgi:ketosteroid isomerase-like protein